ncbi:methyltransferase domain-containing protein [Sphingomonas sp. AP4-R1]|uniref:class I SAM-dependent methyltransferase n=1 Tax=Sphingomonas sp. AP4-R1 TaxID=2735134 RepID=UPI0014932C88|nr:methyltransferase domain-containing protein [Sphingomonas sp. AP4-R1]QJU57622.1 methyltransferase domain-containing protein [Sphingomonas sp. AP4-R1]
MTYIFQKHKDDLPPELDMRIKCDSQSLSFYSDISNFLGDNIPGYLSHSLLDVGARTAAGTALLRAIHHPRSFARLKLHQVTALDLDATAIAQASNEYQDIECLAVDVNALANVRSWDIVLSSHTIEHVDDPSSFLASLETVATRYVVIACPFAEVDLTEGHVHRFNMAFFEEHRFDAMKVYRSQHWHGGMACVALKRLQQN